MQTGLTVLVLCTVLAGPVSALTITNGGFALHIDGQQVYIEQDGLFINAQTTNAYLAAEAFGAGPLEFLVRFGGAEFDSTVNLGDQWCDPYTEPDCGELRFSSPGLPPLPQFQQQPFMATAPFSMTGYLLIGGVRHELEGAGLLWGIRCFTDDCPIVNDEGARLDFVFEPPTQHAVTVPADDGWPVTLLFTLTVMALAWGSASRSGS